MVEESMRPAVEPGDWLLLDPIVRRWPRRGSIVVIREPESEILALKRIAARPNDVVSGVVVRDPDTGADVTVTFRLGPDEAWVLGDSRDVSVDSRRYGPVGLDRLVGRAWFRYSPLERLGLLRRPSTR
ncbi:MAG TPA: S26 family signal peptidase [Candidatus Acidoferrum sp.]|nr:S26 family signal peptidase [Candidatus Acidoferrum sp.]